MEIRLLGSIEVLIDGQPVPLGPPKQRAVLAALAMDAGSLVSMDTVIDRIWGDDPPPEVRNALYAYVARLRGLLTDATGGAVSVERRSGGYQLAVDPGLIDVVRARRLVDAAREPDLADDARAALLWEAVELWRGEPLAGVAGQWADRVRDSLAQQRLVTVVQWARAELDRGRADVVVDEVADIVAHHPFAEPLIAVLMRALFLTGRAAEALSLYASATQRIATELGADPGPELREVHAALLRGEFHRSGTRTGQPAARPRPTQLPADVTAFTGRDTELNALDGLMSAVGRPPAVVVSALSGTAGVGKTALAVHWAHRVRDRFPDGQLYVDLRGYDPDQPMSASAALTGFLRALGVEGRALPAEVAEQAALLRTLVADRRLLLILDNAANVEQVRHLLPGSSSCLTLVTSRDSLTALVARHGATRIDLDLLGTDDATQLLRTLTAGRPGSDGSDVAGLAERCARLPLALRIAAEYLNTHPEMTYAELADELLDEQRRLDLLDAGGEERTDVRAVFAWSYRGLPADAARAFRLLGLHPGGEVDRHAAAALLDADPEEAGRLLEFLLHAHVLQEPAEGRFTMHDLLRVYAQERAAAEQAADDRSAAVLRLLDYYLATTDRAMALLAPFEQRPGPAAVTAHVRPLDTAAEALAWLDANRASLVAAVRLAEEVGSHEHVFALAVSGWRYFNMGAHHAEAMEVHERALRVARDRGDKVNEGFALRHLSIVLGWNGRRDEAIAHASRALDIYREAGDRLGEARALLNLGTFALMLGKLADALTYSTFALDIFDDLGDEAGAGTSLSNRAGAHFMAGDHAATLDDSRRAVELLTKAGDVMGVARILGNLGELYERLGRHDEALDHYRRSLESFHEAGVRMFEGRVLANMASVLLRLGRAGEAVVTGQRALAAARELGDHEGEISALDHLGMALRQAGRIDEAAEHHSRALDLAVAKGDRTRQSSALSNLGEALTSAGRTHEALTHFRTALSLATEAGNRFGEARALDGMAQAALCEGRVSKARELWEDSLTRYTALDAPEAQTVRGRLVALDA